MTGLKVGDFVRIISFLGGRRGAAVEGESVQVDFFESIAEPITREQWVALWWRMPERPPAKTRVYRRDPSPGASILGRVRGSDLGVYRVKFPHRLDGPQFARAAGLHGRRDRPEKNPVATLGGGGCEPDHLHDGRLLMLDSHAPWGMPHGG